MRSNLHRNILFLILSIQAFAPTFHLWRKQYLNGAPKYYGAGNLSAIGSGNELNQDTQPLSQINSTNPPVALTKALLLNFIDAISKFYPNGSYKNSLELSDIDSKNFTGCRPWPLIGQRIHVQVFKRFTSTTSTSELSFWVYDPAYGFYDHCVSRVPPGWNLLKTYVMSPCLNDNITWALQGRDANTLVIREYIECRGFWALAEAKGQLAVICAPVLDGSQCQTPQYPYVPITSILYFKDVSWSPSAPLAPSGY